MAAHFAFLITKSVEIRLLEDPGYSGLSREESDMACQRQVLAHAVNPMYESVVLKGCVVAGV